VSLRGFEHRAITVAAIERSIAFHRSALGRSVYLRDSDGNLLELRSTVDP